LLQEKERGENSYVDLANLGSESEMCVGRRVRLVGDFISFEKNFYRLPFTPPSLVCRIDEMHAYTASLEARRISNLLIMLIVCRM
jgi:hypothetical protein